MSGFSVTEYEAFEALCLTYVFYLALKDLNAFIRGKRYRRFLAKRYSNKSTTPRRVKK